MIIHKISAKNAENRAGYFASPPVPAGPIDSGTPQFSISCNSGLQIYQSLTTLLVISLLRKIIPLFIIWEF